MASIASDSEGRRRVLFVDQAGNRRAIYLGKLPLRVAEQVKCRIEYLLAARVTGHAVDAETARWVAELTEGLADKLARAGLIPRRERPAPVTLGELIDTYTATRVDAKPATREVWRQGERGLIDFLGADVALGDVTPGAADEYKLHLVGKGLAPMTIRKRLQFATMIFRAAVRRRLIAANPFDGVTVKASMPDRSRFVTPEETAKLLDACSNHHWRTIIALARFGGLRCPSEVLSLRWQDILWDQDRIIVTSPKTAHHPGKESRVIPLFPQLRAALTEAWELAPEGATFVVDERMRQSAQGPSGWRNTNLRTTMLKIIRRAGLEP